jgi:hypothetical protein
MIILDGPPLKRVWSRPVGRFGSSFVDTSVEVTGPTD